MYIITKRGKRNLRETMIGWKLQVKWIDGTKQWIPLNIFKDSNWVEVVEFAVALDIAYKAAFKCWVPYSLRGKYMIIVVVSSHVRKWTHNYVIDFPTTSDHDKIIDEKNGNIYCKDYID